MNDHNPIAYVVGIGAALGTGIFWMYYLLVSVLRIIFGGKHNDDPS